MTRRLTDEEKALLKAAMQDVAPLHKKTHAEEAKPALPAKQKKIPRPAPPPVKAEPPAKGGVDKATVAKVKRGEYPIEAKIDLHGLTLEQAHGRLAAFIDAQHRKEMRCLLVVTGRSGALNREVPRWLALSDMARKILVVSSARPQHGGQGALYVLLRRKR